MELFQTAKQTFDFPSFYRHVEELYKENLATGEEQSEERLVATAINLKRMDRLYRKTEISDHLVRKVNAINEQWRWYVIVEGWCGDGAQNLPVLAKLAEQTDKIKLEIILRDENPQIMDQYLTNGGRAIPKLICISEDNGEEKGSWGPRPKMIAKMARDLKANKPDIDHAAFVKQLHLWYAKDKSQSLITDIKSLINKWKTEEKTTTA